MKPRHPLLHRCWRTALWVFPIVVLLLLARAARRVDWMQVGAALSDYDAGTLAVAALLTLASYLVYSGYDIAARRYAHHDLPLRQVMPIAVIAYAFALNIGALIGGTGLRLRMYTHAGLPVAAVARIVAFSAGTNWLGYLLLGGLLFASGVVVPPPRLAIAAGGLQALGAAMLAVVVLYLWACWRLHGRMFHLRGHHFRLPSVPLAFVQFALAATNWALMAATVFVLLPDGVDYATTLGALLLAAVVTALAHVPAGVGVMEAAFVAAFAGRIGTTPVLAALLAYRAVYYVAPLLLALLGYGLREVRGRARGQAKR